MKTFKLDLTCDDRHLVYEALYHTVQTYYSPELYTRELANSLLDDVSEVEFTCDQLAATFSGLELLAQDRKDMTYLQFRNRLKGQCRERHRLIC